MRKIVFDFSNIDKSELVSESPDDVKQEKSNTEDIYEYIDRVMKSQNGNMGLGVHAVRKEKVKGKSVDEVLKGISEDGLEIKKGSSVLATISSLGVSSELKHHQRIALREYRLGSEVAENGVVVLVPAILKGHGEQLYVGFPGMDTTAMGNNHKITCILDQLCCGENEYGKFPKEFILGYFKEENGQRKFQKNMSHFFEMTDEEKGVFIKSLLDRLTEQQKQISEAVIAGDMQSLEQLSEEMCGNRDGVLGENTVIQNAMFYLNRDRVQAEHRNETSPKPSKRKILLDAYKDVKLSDLTVAKENLREGIEEPEKNSEGKEI